MSALEGLDTTTAERAYALANTPYSLVRRLQADPLTSQLRRQKSPQQLLDALKAALAHSPTHIKEVVEPFVLLVSLSNGRDLAPLKRAATFDAPHARWYKEIAEVLIATYQATSSSIIVLPGEVPALRPGTMSGTPTKTITFDLSPK